MDLPLHAQTLYAELLQLKLAQRLAHGSIYFQTKKGARYAYLRQTVGSARLDEFIGPESEAASQERIAALRVANNIAKECRKLVSLLLSAGCVRPLPALGNVIEAYAHAGLFKGGVLVGTAAYQCFGPLLGVRLHSSAITTQDADFATASLAITSNDGGQSMLDILKLANPGFRPILGLKPADPPSAFVTPAGFMADLLTQQRSRTDRNPVALSGLNAGAAPFQHLGWLIDQPVPAAALYRSGVLISVPQPAKFAVHKLIVADKRGAHETTKRAKDLIQASILIDIFSQKDPDTLADAMADAVNQGHTGWAEPVRRSLRAIGKQDKFK